MLIIILNRVFLLVFIFRISVYLGFFLIRRMCFCFLFRIWPCVFIFPKNMPVYVFLECDWTCFYSMFCLLLKDLWSSYFTDHVLLFYNVFPLLKKISLWLICKTCNWLRLFVLFVSSCFIEYAVVNLLIEKYSC